MKLAPCFIAPFMILDIINRVAVRLELPPALRIPLVINHFTTVQKPPAQVTVQDQTEYKVSNILDSCLSRDSLQYLVHQKNYGPEERSWVKSSDLHAPRLIKASIGSSPPNLIRVSRVHPLHSMFVYFF